MDMGDTSKKQKEIKNDYLYDITYIIYIEFRFNIKQHLVQL